MDVITNFLKEYIVLIILVSIPTFYLMIRDFFSYLKYKKIHQEKLKEVAQSERRLEELYSKMTSNRDDLTKRLKQVEDQFKDALDKENG
jgi:biopolymer transport protein ExbB/TolQ